MRTPYSRSCWGNLRCYAHPAGPSVPRVLVSLGWCRNSLWRVGRAPEPPRIYEVQPKLEEDPNTRKQRSEEPKARRDVRSTLNIHTFPEPLFSLLFLCSLLFSPFYHTFPDTAQRATVNRTDHLFQGNMFLVLYNSFIIFDVRQQAASSYQQHGPPGCAKR